jgi:ketosteroid isomerase-like protein
VAARENAEAVRGLFAAFARKDAFALRSAFAPEAVWVVPGDGVMAGTYRGPEEILRFLGRLPRETGGTYASRLIDVLSSEERAAALYRATGERAGRRLDLDQVLLFRFEEGRIRHVLALPTDPAVFDAFWA